MNKARVCALRQRTSFSSLVSEVGVYDGRGAGLFLPIYWFLNEYGRFAARFLGQEGT